MDNYEWTLPINILNAYYIAILWLFHYSYGSHGPFTDDEDYDLPFFNIVIAAIATFNNQRVGVSENRVYP